MKHLRFALYDTMRADRLGKSLAAVTLLEYAAFTLTKAQDCLPYPIPINIGNVSLSNQKMAWGIGLTVVTPEQNLAFMPQWYVYLAARR